MVLSIASLNEFFSTSTTLAVVAAVVSVIVIVVVKIVSAQKSCTYYSNPSPRMKGKTVIITGATSGIGKETAKEVAKRGARVILACRNPINAAIVKAEITAASGNDNVAVQELDLASQSSVRGFARRILETEVRLDVLVHNAGTAENRVRLTGDNIETTMATNHFGPFLLTHLLIGLLKASAPSRIVVVASELYKLASLDLDNLNPTSHCFPPYIYYPSKYANICFTLELARRLHNTAVTVNCLHPGMIDSGIWRNVPVPFNWPMQFIARTFFKTPEQGCQTSVYLICSDDVNGVSGKYFMDCKEAELNAGVKNEEKAKKLWELSANYVNLSSEDPQI